MRTSASFWTAGCQLLMLVWKVNQMMLVLHMGLAATVVAGEN
jgi:hypothetical protein